MLLLFAIIAAFLHWPWAVLILIICHVYGLIRKDEKKDALISKLKERW